MIGHLEVWLLIMFTTARLSHMKLIIEFEILEAYIDKITKMGKISSNAIEYFSHVLGQVP